MTTREELNAELSRALATPDNHIAIRNLREQLRDLDTDVKIANLADMAARAELRDKLNAGVERLKNLKIEQTNLRGRANLSILDQERLSEITNQMSAIISEIDGLIEA
jgi:hypothetical protein